MKTETIAVVMVVAILAGAGVGYLFGNANERTITSVSTSPTTTTVELSPAVTIYTILTASTTTETVTSYTPIVTAGCDVPSDMFMPIFAPASTNSSERGQLAAVMEPNSNATIYVGYCPFSTGAETLSPSVLVVTCFGGSGGGGCESTPAPNVTIVAVPNQVLFENLSLTIVAYHISADVNSTGYYAIGIPHFCPSVGLAIGHPANQLNRTDFPWMGPLPCPLTFGGVMSVTGANTTYVGLG